MDRKSKVLSTIIALAVLISIGATVHKTLIKKDFEIVQVEEVSGEEVESEIETGTVTEGELL